MSSYDILIKNYEVKTNVTNYDICLDEYHNKINNI